MDMKRIIFTCAVLLMTAAAFADPDNSNLEETMTSGDYQLKASVGAMVFWTPKYEGADTYQLLYMPEVDLEYGPMFASVSQGVGIYLPVNESRSIIFAPAIRWRVKRNLGDPRDAIQYIMDVRPTATLNTIFKLDTFMFNFRITEGLATDNPGATFNLGLTWQDDVSDKINLTLYATAIYGDRAYNQTYFGINAKQSARYGFAEHRASAGLKSIDAGGLIKYFITDKISIDFMTEFLRLVGPVTKSPIVLEKNQWLFGLGATYKF